MQPPIAKRTAFIPVSSRHYPKKKKMRCDGHVPPAKPGKAGGLLVAGPSKGSGRNRICEKPSTTTLAATCTSMTTIARGSREQKQQRAVKRDPATRKPGGAAQGACPFTCARPIRQAARIHSQKRNAFLQNIADAAADGIRRKSIRHAHTKCLRLFANRESIAVLGAFASWSPRAKHKDCKTRSLQVLLQATSLGGAQSVSFGPPRTNGC